MLEKRGSRIKKPDRVRTQPGGDARNSERARSEFPDIRVDVNIRLAFNAAGELVVDSIVYTCSCLG